MNLKTGNLIRKLVLLLLSCFKEEIHKSLEAALL